MLPDYFEIAGNGFSYRGLPGPVIINLGTNLITTIDKNSAGYQDLIIGKNGIFPNHACGSINDDTIYGNSNTNYLYGDLGNDNIYG